MGEAKLELFFFVLAYLFLINTVGIVLMYWDKKRAVKGEWRIKEKTLFNIALLGGSIGILLGSKQFRHKTHHKLFKYGTPAILTFQIAVLTFIVYYFRF
ncbi:MAG: DUF1294 domain-containing protein [Tepidanaerobacteraceae bacterium]|nr:DUF1294 domain-containing protein [Tepidanaerobacteraceae bacterium]